MEYKGHDLRHGRFRDNGGAEWHGWFCVRCFRRWDAALGTTPRIPTAACDPVVFDDAPPAFPDGAEPWAFTRAELQQLEGRASHGAAHSGCGVKSRFLARLGEDALVIDAILAREQFDAEVSDG